jgi:hypothetical protein
MPRDGSGNYTLPSPSNPVVSGTIIDVTWANPTMNDIAAQLNNVLTRDGLLGATTAIKFIAGSGAAPGMSFTTDPATGVFLPTAGALGFASNGVERMRIDAAGQVGIGMVPVAATATLQIAGSSALSFGDAAWMLGYVLTAGGGQTGTISGATSPYYGVNMAVFTGMGGAGLGVHGSSGVIMSTAGIERIRIDANGVLLIGKSYPSDAIAGSAFYPAGELRMAATGTSSTNHIAFYRNGSTTAVGSIISTSTTTTYNTSSDIRLKKDIVDAASASSKVDALQVRSYKWKSNDEVEDYGFVAQELVSVFPRAVTIGDIDDEITKVWSVDYSKLVPLLVKEIQELRTRVAALERSHDGTTRVANIPVS